MSLRHKYVFYRLANLGQMPTRLQIVSLAWRRWIFCLALVSFIGLYSAGLLPHRHDRISDKLDCPVCHVVHELSSFTADFEPPRLEIPLPVLQLLLVVSSLVIAAARHERLLSALPRAPPPVS
jgi:hypothetical protein